MKQIGKWICLAAALCLLLTALPPAFAEETSALSDARFEGKTWEQVTDEFMEEHHADPERVTIGYCNTVTGEEYYHRGDEYMISASLYKVPLNMVYSERVANGEMDWDTVVCGYQYKKALEESIVNSNNPLSQKMGYALGKNNWRAFRETLVPYMCEDPDNVDEMFFKNNYSTARQMIFCLKLLYDNPDRFPRVLDAMKRAEPKNYFNYHPQSVEIAHKYGYLVEGNQLVLNDSGICFTEDPFCLVVFTQGIVKPYEFLADYCTLMIDYTEYHTAFRHEEELRKSRENAIQALESTPAPTEAAAQSAQTADGRTAEQQEQTVTATVTETDSEKTMLTVVVLVATALGLIAVLVSGLKKQLRVGWAALSVLLAALAVLMCVYAPEMKPTFSVAEPVGEPQESVRAFFDAVVEKDYPKAYSYLIDYASLGMENRPEGEAAQLLYDALCDSYSYTLYGDCVKDGLSARQQVLLDVLDLTALQADLKAETEKNVKQINEERPMKEVLDENGDYRPEITNEAYLSALREVLSHPDRYRTTVGLELELSYTRDGWRIVTNTQLLSALSGRTVYGRGGENS